MSESFRARYIINKYRVPWPRLQGGVKGTFRSIDFRKMGYDERGGKCEALRPTGLGLRSTAVQELKGFEGWILDIATGTGDVAIEILHQNGHKKKVIGLDFSDPMIRRAQYKVIRRRHSQRIVLSLGDALALPFRADTFTASIIAFGLRNIVMKEQALAEMVRVIKEGGKVIILEFTFPRNRLVRRLYPIYFKKILPWLGGLISRDRAAYSYLPESVYHFQNAEKYEGIMRKVGLSNVNSCRLTCGIASIITGIKRC
jgi:demethylmenaquinone methyltransferase/2-methoxy-6-polyprenyl-1,4-benzoquinol methylase